MASSFSLQRINTARSVTKQREEHLLILHFLIYLQLISGCNVEVETALIFQGLMVTCVEMITTIFCSYSHTKPHIFSACCLSLLLYPLLWIRLVCGFSRGKMKWFVVAVWAFIPQCCFVQWTAPKQTALISTAAHYYGCFLWKLWPKWVWSLRQTELGISGLGQIEG